MMPITTFRNGNILDLNSNDLYSSIIDICNEHKRDNRALAFAFILYNVNTPQVIKMLRDDDYWNSLNDTSGSFLSVFYIVQREKYFGEDLINHDGIERRGLYGIKNSSDNFKPILKNYFQLDENLKLPSVLFFQVNGELMSDYFIVELDERKVEDSFWELQDYIQKAVNSLDGVKLDINHNSSEIFTLLKDGVTMEKLKKRTFRFTQKFPVQLLAGWLTGKI